MTRRSGTLPPDYFESLYRSTPDPWGFETSAYERDKYQATLDALRPHYRHGLEVGCSIGVFTEQLAARCDALRAIDASETALAIARRRCAGRPNATFANRMVPAGFPEGPFDLIVLSEVLYYLDRSDLARVAECCSGALTPEGEIVLCHWLGETDYPLSGREASDLFVEALIDRVPIHAILFEGDYRLDRLSRA